MGLGFGVAQFVLAILGLGIAVAGYFVLNKEQKKEKEKQKTGMKVLGFALMIVGIALLGGIGISTLFSEVSEEI